jgi:2'-5' RNA ligase
MTRLFVAVDLPASVTVALAALQPQATSGIRLVEPTQMHLTLHFLGEMDTERVAVALAAVAVPEFALTFAGVGQFTSADGAITLWARVRAGPELPELHAAVAAALAGEGFRPEARRYTPHVTLARCGPEVPGILVEEFLARHAAYSPAAVPVTNVGLYSSSFTEGVPVYRRERSFPLRADRTDLPTEVDEL